MTDPQLRNTIPRPTREEFEVYLNPEAVAELDFSADYGM